MRAVPLIIFTIGTTVASNIDFACAQDQQCMPGGICCAVVGQSDNGPERRCGTLEQFEQYAKVVCLRGEATENKGFAESIEASGECLAARIAAERVASTQQENAQAHTRAMEAQRKLREMGDNSGAARAKASAPTFKTGHSETVMKQVYVRGVPVEVWDNGNSHIVVAGDRVLIRDKFSTFISINGIYEGDGRVFLLLSKTAGNVCSEEFQAIDMTSAEPKISESFGGCASITSAAVSGGALVVAFKALNGKNTETFTFRDGALTSTKTALSLEPKGPEGAPGGDLAAYVYQKQIGEVFSLRPSTAALKKIMSAQAFEEARDLAISGPGTRFEVKNEMVRATACQSHMCPFHAVAVVFDHKGNAWASILRGDGKLEMYGNPPPFIKAMLSPSYQ